MQIPSLHSITCYPYYFELWLVDLTIARMSLRSLTKVYKYCLVFFPSDNSYSVLPSKNIKEVKSGDKFTKGSKVLAVYNRETWNAEICAADGKFCINCLSVFVPDP